MVATSFLITVASMALSASASCMHGTSFMKRQVSEDGKKVAVSTFGYSGEKGPVNWASLAKENESCRTGKIQSPIVLDNSIGKAKEKPVIKIADVKEAEFENLGTTLETIVEGTTTFAGKEFKLKQFHMHTPSEHRINDEYFPLEIHMVHEAADKSIAVIAIPFQLTEDNTTTELLTSVIANIDKVTVPGTVTKTGPLKFAPLVNILQTKPLFQYTGSLTTPPCAEGLTFLVLEEPQPINVATFNKIKKVIKFNARTIQNTLGKGNILTIAEDLAIAAKGGNVAEKVEGGDVTNLDGNALAKLLAAARNSTEINVVTTTTTQTKIVTNGKAAAEQQKEAPKQEAPKQEAPKQEAPKQQEQQKEAPKQEAPKQEAPKNQPINIEVPKQGQQQQPKPAQQQTAGMMDHKPRRIVRTVKRSIRRLD
jgi:carbonic anhydrase